MNAVFLSHSSRDKSLVRRIAKALESRGIPVWIDEAELDIGDSLIERIAVAIHDVDFVVAVISRNSYKSNWVRKELSLAMTREIEGKQVIVLPVLIHDVDIPLTLRDKLYADMRNLRNFDQQVGRLVQSIRKRSDADGQTGLAKMPQPAEGEISGSESPAVGSPLFPTHSTLAPFYAFQHVVRMRYQYGVVFGLGFGIIIFAMILAARSETGIVSPVLLTSGALFLAASVVGFFSQHYISRALENDSALVLALEDASDRYEFRTRYRIGKANRRFRRGCRLELAYLLLMVLGLLAALLVLTMVIAMNIHLPAKVTVGFR